MIALAQQKYQDPRVVFKAEDVLALPEDDFDLAIIYSAYPHFPDKPALVAQTARLLKPGGRFLVAHSESRRTINARHHTLPNPNLSSTLQPARQEASVWSSLFEIDLLGDNNDIYFFSGTKREHPIQEQHSFK